jgi:hypothetical protein
MTSFGRHLLRLTAVLATTGTALVAVQSSGLADPGGQPVTRCSSWAQVGAWQDKACVTMDPSSASIRHDHYVEYLGSGSATGWAASFYYVNSSNGICKFDVQATYSSGQVRSYTCYSARRTGYIYKTEGYFDYGAHDVWVGHVVSPTVTG